MTTDVNELRKQKEEILQIQKDLNDKLDRIAFIEKSIETQDKDLTEVSIYFNWWWV